MALQEGTPLPQHREEVILSSQYSKQQQEDEPRESFPAVLGREASNVQSIFRQASAKLGFGRGTGSAARDNPHHSAARPPAVDNSAFVRERGQEEVHVNDSTRPTRPAIARTATQSPQGRRTASLRQTSSGGNSINPIRQLSRLLRFGRSGSSGSSAAAAAALPWQAYQGVSKSLNYRPRGHGQAFAESYDVGNVLGSGGFAAVLAGELFNAFKGRAANPWLRTHNSCGCISACRVKRAAGARW